MSIKNHASSGGIYGFGVIGSAIYYFQHATTASLVVWGIIKAVFWPAVIVYKVLELWKM